MANAKIAGYLIPSFLAFLIISRLLPQPETSAIASSPAGNLSPSVIRAVILTDSWPIKKVVSIPSGDLAFAGGDLQNGADGLVLVTADRNTKIARTGDPVPGREGLFLSTVGIIGLVYPHGPFDGDFSLNTHGELAFTANFVSCDSPSNVPRCALQRQQEGLFLFSEQSRTTIALQGDPSPGMAGGTFRSFGRVLLNDESTVVFAAQISKADGSSTNGLFSFSQNQLENIITYGDTTPFGKIYLSMDPSPFLLDDKGVLTFSGSSSLFGGPIIFRIENGVLSKLLSPGDPTPGGQVSTIIEVDANTRGDVVFRDYGASNALYLRAHDGTVSRIIQSGDSTPIGGTFALYGTNTIDAYPLVLPEINDSGEVLFLSPISGGPASSGLFQAARGAIRKVVSDGDPVPDNPGMTMRLVSSAAGSRTEYSSNGFGRTAFSAFISDPSGVPGLFTYSNDRLDKLFISGDSAPGTDGESFKDLNEFSVSDSGDVTFHASLCCGKYKEGIFRASLPPSAITIPNGSFETLGNRNLPAGWQTVWNNSGSGEASRFNCGAKSAADRSSVLRLHVNPGGGSVFVLSDPIPVSADTFYQITGQMRYYLLSASDAVYFSVIQFDSAGNLVGFDEVKGVEGDNFWTWVPKGVLIRPMPGAVSIRIRIGLSTGSESYLDVDAVQNR